MKTNPGLHAPFFFNKAFHHLPRKSVLFRQVASFGLLVLVLISIFSLTYQNFHKILQQEIQHSNQLFLDIISNEANKQMQSLEDTISFVCNNTKFREMCSGVQKNSSFYRKVSDLTATLHDYYNAKGIDCLVYFPDLEYAVSPTTANEIHTLYHRQKMSGLDRKEDEWVENLSLDETKFFFSNEYSLLDNQFRLVYGRSLVFNQTPVKIYASIPASLLNQAAILSNSILLVADEEDRVLTSFDETGAFSSWEEIPPNQTTLTDHNGNTYVLSSKESPFCNWKYIVATPNATYWETALQGQRLLIGAIIFAALAGLLFTLPLAQINYRPMSKLMDTLRGYGSGNNEYDVISSAFEKMRDENLTYKENINAQNDRLRSQWLLARLKGQKFTQRNKEINAYHSIQTVGRTWCLINLSVQSSLEETETTAEFQEWLGVALNNVLSEVMKEFTFYFLEDGKELFILLCMDCEQLVRWQKEKQLKLDFIYRFFKENMHAVITGAVSRYTDDFEQIDKLYAEAMRVHDHRAVMGEVGIVSVEEYQKRQNHLFNNTDLFSELEKAVSEGNSTNAVALAESIFGRLGKSGEDFALLKIEINECMYRLLLASNENSDDPHFRQRLINQALDIAIYTETISTLRDKFIATVQMVCSSVRRTISEGNPIVSLIDKYVEENYSDINLNVTTIADHFDKHPNYISKMYYSETGTQLLDHIHQVRIHHAKELLRQKNATIEKVAEQTGFNTTRTFRRVFMTETGLNPSEYQKKYC